jgi:hypothetical protein
MSSLILNGNVQPVNSLDVFASFNADYPISVPKNRPASDLAVFSLYVPEIRELRNQVMVGSVQHLLEGAFVTLAGRYSSTIGIFSAQAAALLQLPEAQRGNFHSFARRVIANQLDLASCAATVPILSGGKVITTSNQGFQYAASSNENGLLTSEQFARWDAFSGLIQDVQEIGFKHKFATGLELHQLVGVKADGYRAANLEALLLALINSGKDNPVMLNDIPNRVGVLENMHTLAESLQITREKGGAGLLETERYHGGYQLKNSSINETGSQSNTQARLVAEIQSRFGFNVFSNSDLHQMVSQIPDEFKAASFLRGFRNKHLDCLDPGDCNKTMAFIQSDEQFQIVKALLKALTNSKKKYEALVYNHSKLTEMFNSNFLSHHDVNRGEVLGIHSQREATATILLDYMLKLQRLNLTRNAQPNTN